MDIANVHGKINCDHRIFLQMNDDEIVEKVPITAVLVHKCPEVEVYQKKRGLKRYYKLAKQNGSLRI